jgi:signal-transduction protein with cAMP-binding, CBS, and nucleotidyltransferase domain
MNLDLAVGAIAKKKMVTIDEDKSTVSAAMLMTEKRIGSLVVTRENKPVGIVTERDMLKKVLSEGRNPETTKVAEIMTSHLVTVEHDKPLREALDLMNRRGIRRMLVTHEGQISGIFTQRDVLALSRMCLYCGKEITSALEAGKNAQPYVECQCGSRYHQSCAATVVHCLDCSRMMVTDVVYPEPSETMAG